MINASELDRLMGRVKCCMDIDVNGHKGMYETIGMSLKNVPLDEVSTNRREELAAGDTLVYLRMYPRTPVSFYDFWGASIDDVVAQAHKTLDETGEA